MKDKAPENCVSKSALNSKINTSMQDTNNNNSYDHNNVTGTAEGSCRYTVSEAEVGGINNVRPPSTHSLLRNKVAGLGAKYLKQEKINRLFIKQNITK